MPRKPIQPRKKQQGLTRPERHLLETGHPYPPKGSWTDYGEKWAWVMMLCGRAHVEQLKALWMTHREDILREWKEAGKRGKPWAARQFDGE